MTIRRILSLYTSFTGVLMMIIALALCVSCVHIEEVGDSYKRTVLVYIAADNNGLTGAANSNLLSMKKSLKIGIKDANLLVFVDKEGAKPMLLRMHDGRQDTLIVYKEMDSSKPAVLSYVIDYVRENWQADYYGLVLWSHGTGWIPTSQLHFVAPNFNYIQSRDGSHGGTSVLKYQRYASEGTKAFAWEDKYNQTPPYSCMELDDLAKVIPDGMFDYIVFDACYMGNVEVAYALRHKARYIVSSCYEIVDQGLPYKNVTCDLLKGNLIKICRDFYSYYYDYQSGWERMAGISLVKTDQLDSLAHCFRKIVAERKDIIPKINVAEIQHFDRFRNHVFYDLEDFVDKIGTNDEFKKEFHRQLEECIPFKKSTPYIFPDNIDSIKVEKYCGLSVYIPVSKYEASGLNDDYRKTEWSIDTDY